MSKKGKSPATSITAEQRREIIGITSQVAIDDYGTDSAKIGLITDQMYRAFRKIIPKASEDYWTCTPFSTERNGYKSFVRYVSTSGALSH